MNVLNHLVSYMLREKRLTQSTLEAQSNFDIGINTAFNIFEKEFSLYDIKFHKPYEGVIFKSDNIHMDFYTQMLFLDRPQFTHRIYYENSEIRMKSIVAELYFLGIREVLFRFT